MRVLLVALILPFAFVVGCTPKSEVDKCVEAWEATVKSIPDDDEKRLNVREGKPTTTKAEERFSIRVGCMETAGGQ